MRRNVFGRVMVFKFQQPAKALSPSVSTPSDSVTFSSAQPMNASSPISRRVDGSVISFSADAAANASQSITVTPSGMTTLVSAAYSKAYAPIAVTCKSSTTDGITSAVSSPR